MQKKTKDCPHLKGTIHSIKNISKQHSQNKTRQEKKTDRGALARVQLLIIKTTLSKQEKQKNKTKTDCVDIINVQIQTLCYGFQTLPTFMKYCKTVAKIYNLKRVPRIIYYTITL